MAAKTRWCSGTTSSDAVRLTLARALKVGSAAVLLGALALLPAPFSRLQPNVTLAAGLVPNSATSVWALTFVKARPGQRQRLERFLRANWLTIDAQALQEHRILDYRFWRADDEARATWDFAVAIEYQDRAAMADFVSAYLDLARQRPFVRVDGLGFADLGSVAFQNVVQSLPLVETPASVAN